MAPILHELARHPEQFHSVVIVTAQHREMLEQVLGLFPKVPIYDLDVMCQDQSLTAVSCRTLTALEPILRYESPDIVLVQGDTTTTLISAVAAFYHRIPIGHIEAGLRTHNKYQLFPG